MLRPETSGYINDLGNATLPELEAVLAEVNAAVQEKSLHKKVEDALLSAVMNARNKGIKRGEVMQLITDVIGVAYGKPQQ